MVVDYLVVCEDDFVLHEPCNRKRVGADVYVLVAFYCFVP